MAGDLIGLDVRPSDRPPRMRPRPFATVPVSYSAPPSKLPLPHLLDAIAIATQSTTPKVTGANIAPIIPPHMYSSACAERGGGGMQRCN